MKWYCERCRKGFTTIGFLRDEARAFETYNTKKMACPHCGSISGFILDRLCAKMGAGIGELPVCEKCKQYFNCYTGNVDDGTVRVQLEEEPKNKDALLKLYKTRLDEYTKDFAFKQLRLEVNKGYYYLKYRQTTYKFNLNKFAEMILFSVYTEEIIKLLERENILEVHFNNFIRLFYLLNKP